MSVTVPGLPNTSTWDSENITNEISKKKPLLYLFSLFWSLCAIVPTSYSPPQGCNKDSVQNTWTVFEYCAWDPEELIGGRHNLGGFTYTVTPIGHTDN